VGPLQIATHFALDLTEHMDFSRSSTASCVCKANTLIDKIVGFQGHKLSFVQASNTISDCRWTACLLGCGDLDKREIRGDKI